jgi:hypothetical protein
MKTFAGAGLCRDERTRPLSDKIRETRGRPSLSPVLPTGSSWAQPGSPPRFTMHPMTIRGRATSILPCRTSVLTRGEETGWCDRSGQRQISKACGALVAFREELESGT